MASGRDRRRPRRDARGPGGGRIGETSTADDGESRRRDDELLGDRSDEEDAERRRRFVQKPPANKDDVEKRGQPKASETTSNAS